MVNIAIVSAIAAVLSAVAAVASAFFAWWVGREATKVGTTQLVVELMRDYGALRCTIKSVHSGVFMMSASVPGRRSLRSLGACWIAVTIRLTTPVVQ